MMQLSVSIICLVRIPCVYSPSLTPKVLILAKNIGENGGKLIFFEKNRIFDYPI